MKLLKQFLIIVMISFLGEILNRIIPLPVPASIYGLILMFCALHFRIFPLSSVKDAGGFLLNIMPLMFVPPGVAIIEHIDVLKAHGIQILLTVIISTVAVMAVTGLTVQGIIRLKNKNGGK